MWRRQLIFAAMPANSDTSSMWPHPWCRSHKMTHSFFHWLIWGKRNQPQICTILGYDVPDATIRIRLKTFNRFNLYCPLNEQCPYTQAHIHFPSYFLVCSSRNFTSLAMRVFNTVLYRVDTIQTIPNIQIWGTARWYASECRKCVRYDKRIVQLCENIMVMPF